MIRLPKTTTKIEIVLGEAHGTGSVKANAWFYDVRASWKQDNAEYRGDWSKVSSNGVTAATLVSAPAANTIRNIDSMAISNQDSITHGVYVQIDDNGTDYIIASYTLAPGECLMYESGGNGWHIV